MTQPKRQFLVDEKGQKKAVVISIEEYQEIMEDLEDLAIIAERREEPAEPFRAVKKRLGKRCYSRSIWRKLVFPRKT